MAVEGNASSVRQHHRQTVRLAARREVAIPIPAGDFTVHSEGMNLAGRDDRLRYVEAAGEELKLTTARDESTSPAGSSAHEPAEARTCRLLSSLLASLTTPRGESVRWLPS